MRNAVIWIGFMLLLLPGCSRLPWAEQADTDEKMLEDAASLRARLDERCAGIMRDADRMQAEIAEAEREHRAAKRAVQIARPKRARNEQGYQQLVRREAAFERESGARQDAYKAMYRAAASLNNRLAVMGIALEKPDNPKMEEEEATINFEDAEAMPPSAKPTSELSSLLDDTTNQIKSLDDVYKDVPNGAKIGNP